MLSFRKVPAKRLHDERLTIWISGGRNAQRAGRPAEPKGRSELDPIVGRKRSVQLGVVAATSDAGSSHSGFTRH